ncbi:MAG: RsmD family RNA methyltransferase [Armatimonadota bacterium]
MRVIAGSAGSLQLQCPKGLRIRPTADIIRETLFNSLGPIVAGAAFCDLYAGCGTVGIEAASRGAAPVVFIERTRLGVEAIRANAEHCNVADVCEVIRGDVVARYMDAAEQFGPFDIVFVDPPYGAAELPGLAKRLVGGDGMAEQGTVVLQYPGRQELEGVREADRVKEFGETELAFFFLET